MSYEKLSKRKATATVLLLTFSRQRAPEDLAARIRSVCVEEHADELLRQNEAFATASEIDVLRLTMDQLDRYERMFAAQVELAKARLTAASYRDLDLANAKATAALLEWSACTTK